jgi:hypothetical protein
VILCDIELEDRPAAVEATQRLLGSFAHHQSLPRVVWSIAQTYRDREDWGRCRPLCEYILENHITAKDAIYAQKALVYASITERDTAGVDTGIQTLLSTFSSHGLLPETTYWIARELGGIDSAKAQELCRYILENFPADDFALLAKVNLAQMRLREGDDAPAEAAFQEVLAGRSNSGPATIPVLPTTTERPSRSGRLYPRPFPIRRRCRKRTTARRLSIAKSWGSTRRHWSTTGGLLSPGLTTGTLGTPSSSWATAAKD